MKNLFIKFENFVNHILILCGQKIAKIILALLPKKIIDIHLKIKTKINQKKLAKKKSKVKLKDKIITLSKKGLEKSKIFLAKINSLLNFLIKQFSEFNIKKVNLKLPFLFLKEKIFTRLQNSQLSQSAKIFYAAIVILFCLSLFKIYQTSHQIIAKLTPSEQNQRSPASISGLFPKERPPFHKGEDRQFEVFNVKIPVSNNDMKINGMRTLIFDFIVETNNKYSKQYLIEN